MSDGTRYHRRIIRIRAVDSPNVRLAIAEMAKGFVPSGRTLVPGVLSWDDYQFRLNTWDEIRQCVGLNAEFWQGADVLMFPPEWLNRAERIAISLRGKRREAKAMGVDPGEGVANTSWSVVDELGLIKQVSYRTPDTTSINPQTLSLMREYNLPDEMVVYDSGGGGKQLADEMRKNGYNIRTVWFGEKVTLPIKRGMTRVEEKRDNREDRNTYINRRAEMYGELRELLNPARGLIPASSWVLRNIGAHVLRDTGMGFAIPPEYVDLRRQLAPIPLRRDSEGRLYILPKNKKNPDSKEKTLTELIGRSPDELDSLVLAVWAMQNKPQRTTAGVARI